MSTDITRSTFNPVKHYSGVRQQQGRVSLDADWNEQVDIASHRVQTGALDILGHSGAPRDNAGFGIFPLSQPAISTDMAISPGRIYVDGLMCELESTLVPVVLSPAAGSNVQAQLAGLVADGQEFKAGQWVEISAQDNTGPVQVQIQTVDATAQTLTLPQVASRFIGKPRPQVRRITTYLTQPDLPSPAPLPTSGIAIAYLDVWERPITSLEDAEIRETALGSASGAETTTRTRTVRQVRVQPVDVTTTCANAPSFDSSAFDSAIRPSTARLAARAEPTAAATSACILPPQAGFRRLENQLYRVEIHNGGDLSTGAPLFKWSRDNGSVTTAIVSTPPALSGTTLTLNVASLGRDRVLNFAVGQIVELTDDTSELQNRPGVLVKLTGAAMDATGPVLTAETPSPVPADVTSFLNAFSTSLNPKVRRWDQASAGIPVQEGVWLDLESGVQVFFEPGGRYRGGDYWLIPARTLTGDVDWPRNSGGNPQFSGAIGIRHHYCRLGIINFSAKSFSVIGDCRPVFPALSDAGIHINGVFLETGALIPNDGMVALKDLAGGISVVCDTPVDVSSLHSGAFIKPTCFVVIDVPQTSAGSSKPFGAQPTIVYADVGLDPTDSSGSTILWKPTVDASTWLTGPLAQLVAPVPLLAHITLKGNFIWGSDNPQLLLDGETFGTPAAPDISDNRRTEVLLPGGDGRRGGDFQMWFWLISPSLLASAAKLDFGTVTTGSSSTQTVTITNSTSGTLTIAGTITPADFAITSISPTSLASGTASTISIAFTPTVAAQQDGILTITPPAGVAPVSVGLTGSGAAPAGAGLVVKPKFVALKGSSDNNPFAFVTLTNNGPVRVSVISLAVGTTNFEADATVPATLATGESLDISVTFFPPLFVPGTRNTVSDNLTITFAGGPPPIILFLGGTSQQGKGIGGGGKPQLFPPIIQPKEKQ